ncbi:MAG: type III pantothenate kinase [Aquificaceae bacterium]
MKVLTLDVGNTSVDVCLFEGELRYIGKFEHDKVCYVEADLVLVSSVRPSAEAYIRGMYPRARFVRAEEVPLEVAFEGKERVGVDRLLNLYGAVSLYGRDVVVVSAGTALVVDLAIDGIFQGGFITLGIGLGLECLSKKAELIPKIDLKPMRVDIGRNTEEAILGGFINQAKAFISKCLESWQEKYKRTLKLIITGGDGWLFEDLGVYEPLLIHKSLLALSHHNNFL